MSSLLTRAAAVALVLAATLAFSSTAVAAPSWSAASRIGATGREEGTPQLAVAPDGEAIATWVGIRPERIEVSTRRPGGGWSTPISLKSTRGEVEGPVLAVSAGKAVVVWSETIHADLSEARVIMAATRLGGKRWGEPRNISAEKRWREEPEGSEPQVAISRRGKVTVVWTATDERHLATYFVRSATQSATGTRWAAPVGIRGSYEGENPQVGITSTGETVAIWGASYDEESAIGVSSRPKNGPWKGGGRLATPGAFAEPLLAITSKGEAVAAWVKEPEDAFGATVQVATRPAGGKWKVKTLAPKQYGVAPEIVTEPGGRATVLWVKGASFEEQTVLASTHAPGGAWSAPVSVAAEGLLVPVSSESPIAVTPGGESVAIWASGSSFGQATTIEASSRAPAQPWNEPTVVDASPVKPSYGAPDLRLALAPSGEAVALWRSFDGSGWVIKTATRPAANG